jgi:general secretion pathway protein B
MSFILDALKKSENDRQRQSGPALFEVRVAPPRSRFPSWAIALVALLAVNLAVIGWLMLRKPAAAATPPISVASAPATPTNGAPAATAPAPQATPPPAPMTQQSFPSQAMGPPPGYQQQPYPQQQYPQQSYPQQQYAQQQAYPQQSYPQQNLQQQQYSQPVYPQAPPAQQQPPPAFAQNSGQRSPTLDERVQEENPDDYAPATEPTGEAPFGHVRRGLSNGLMTYDEAASKNQIPPLRLDLHVYAPDPRKRFVMVNMKRLTEGESLPEGVHVDSITTDGVILSYRGVQFMMERD